MKKSIRVFVVLFVVLLAVFLLGAKFPTEDLPSYKDPKTTKTVEVKKVTFVKDEYSKWKRLNEVFTCGKRAGEFNLYTETKTVSVASSIDISVPIKAVSVGIGFSVEKTVSSTIRGTGSAPLAANESTAFYYREHWKVYLVEEEVTITTYSNDLTRYTPPTVSKACRTETIKVAQKVDSSDYGWFYATKAKALTKTLDEKYCVDRQDCKVK